MLEPGLGQPIPLSKNSNSEVVEIPPNENFTEDLTKLEGVDPRTPVQLRDLAAQMPATKRRVLHGRKLRNRQSIWRRRKVGMSKMSSRGSRTLIRLTP